MAPFRNVYLMAAEPHSGDRSAEQPEQLSVRPRRRARARGGGVKRRCPGREFGGGWLVRGDCRHWGTRPRRLGWARDGSRPVRAGDAGLGLSSPEKKPCGRGQEHIERTLRWPEDEMAPKRGIVTCGRLGKVLVNDPQNGEEQARQRLHCERGLRRVWGRAWSPALPGVVSAAPAGCQARAPPVSDECHKIH